MFDRTWTVTCPFGSAPNVVALTNLSLPDGKPELEISAWKAAYGAGSNSPATLIFRDAIQLPEAQQKISSFGLTDALLAVPSVGLASARFDGDVRALTVAWVSVAGGANVPDIVQLRIREVTR